VGVAGTISKSCIPMVVCVKARPEIKTKMLIKNTRKNMVFSAVYKMVSGKSL
jgi:hypothetical protein